MKGLKKHTQRQVEGSRWAHPLIEKKFGRNLLALASRGSFARSEDHDYSELELIAFVKQKGKKWGGMSKIRDVLLVELVWMTREV